MNKQKRIYHRYLALLFAVCFLMTSLLTACSTTSEETAANDQAEVTAAVEPTEVIQPTQAPEPTEAPVVNEWPEDFSLYEAYAEDFLLGTIYTDANRSGQDKELTLKHFNVITPENLMKPQYMQPTQGSFSFGASDTMLGFAQENNLKVHGHTLAWHQQSGNWLGKNVTKEAAIEQLKSHIANVVGKYKGQIISWDVVNEAINDGATLPADGDWTKCLRQTQWLTSIGPEYIAIAFTAAREADPDAKLYYNDYSLNNKSKADIVHAMVKDLKAQGVPVDGVGMQGHYNVDTTPGSVEYSIKKFAELGVEVSITELDITVNGAAGSGLTEEQEIKQGITYAKLFKVFKAYRDVIARVTFWGYVDNKSWRKESFPCLFNSDYSPKLAVYAVLDPDAFLKQYDNQKPTEAKNVQAKYGTPTIDGTIDEAWAACPEILVNNQLTAWQGATGKAKVLWDEKYVYALIEVEDSALNSSSANAYEQDSVEIFLDQKNEKNGYYDENDGQYRVNYKGASTFGTVPGNDGFSCAAVETDKGYLIEMAIPLLEGAKEGMLMGFEAQVNDSNSSGMRQGIAKFNDITDNSWNATDQWGTLELTK